MAAGTDPCGTPCKRDWQEDYTLPISVTEIYDHKSSRLVSSVFGKTFPEIVELGIKRMDRDFRDFSSGFLYHFLCSNRKNAIRVTGSRSMIHHKKNVVCLSYSFRQEGRTPNFKAQFIPICKTIPQKS